MWFELNFGGPESADALLDPALLMFPTMRNPDTRSKGSAHFLGLQVRHLRAQKAPLVER
jgi:hypothetical protein